MIESGQEMHLQRVFIIQGLIDQCSLQEMVDFAITSTQLAHTTYGDSPILTKSFIQEKMKYDDLDVMR